MKRLRSALEHLDEALSSLEDKVGLDAATRAESHKKIGDLLKQSQAREAGALAVTQKVALRLDQTIEHVEKLLKKQRGA